MRLVRDDDEPGQDQQQRRTRGLSLTFPLPIVLTLLLQTGGIVYWAAQQGTKIDGVIATQQEIKVELYKESDSRRDLALRDDRIEELKRRLELLECHADGRCRGR